MIILANTIIHRFKDIIKIVGDFNDIEISGISAIANAHENHLTWIHPKKPNKSEIILNTKSRLIITDESIEEEICKAYKKCLIVNSNPKLLFTEIANLFFSNQQKYEICADTHIHSDAKISKEVYIGPNTIIGRATIGKNVRILGNVYISDNTYIGDNVTISAGSVIGSEGFGYTRNIDGKFVNFPQIGGVIISDNVDIGPNSCIDRGALSDTIIEENTKIGHLVYIAHNSKIGKSNLLIANIVISGSVTTGDEVYIAPGVVISDNISIGNNCFVGIGTIVTKSIRDNKRILSRNIEIIELDQHTFKK